MRTAFTLAAACCLLLGACTGGRDVVTGDSAEPNLERGRYIVENLVGCGDCHNPLGTDGRPDPSQALAGRDCFIDVDPSDDSFGCLNAPNLSNHTTGLANRNAQEIKDMFLDGVRPDGTFLSSVMPYYQFHNMTNADADSIVLYLRTIPGIDNRVASNQPPWNEIPAAAEPVDLSLLPVPDASFPQRESAMRGRYLATTLSSCLECHTPVNPPGSAQPRDLSMAFSGGVAFPAAAFGLPVPPFPEVIYTSNLTSDTTGLAGWTAEDIIHVLHQGRDREDKGVCPPMPVGPMGAFGGMSDQDVLDIANYIVSLPAIENENPNGCQAP